MKINTIGNGKVVLISGGGKIYTDIAARFCRSEKELDDIISSPYDKNIVKNIINSGHLAATEFDYFIFGIEGFSRVTETQLVRKRIASYLISSGRIEKNGKRNFSVVLPKNIESIQGYVEIKDVNDILVDDNGAYLPIKDYYPNVSKNNKYIVKLNTHDILSCIEDWYSKALIEGITEEDARYLKPQATEFKAIIGMNSHALLDWFKIRCCMRAQDEIRDLAIKMLYLCKKAAPDLFEKAGPSCVSLGYCPENKFQHEKCKGKKLTHEDVLDLIKRKDFNNNTNEEETHYTTDLFDYNFK